MRASRSQFLEFSQPQAKFYKLKFNKKGTRAFTALHEKCPYSESFWSLFYGIQSECGKIRIRKTPNTDTFHAYCSGVFITGSECIY